MGGGGGGGWGVGHSSCNVSLSQSNVQKNSRALVRGWGGGLKIWKKNARKQSPHLRKNGAYFVLFHSQPNNIGPARQQPTDWGSLNFSESGRRRKGGGGGHSYYLLALRLLYYMRFAMEASREWKMGGTHSSPTALGLGISVPPPPPQTHTPNFWVFLFGTGRGHKSVLFSVTRLQEI